MFVQKAVCCNLLACFSNSQILIKSIVVCYLLEITNILECLLNARYSSKPFIVYCNFKYLKNTVSLVYPFYRREKVM